jgi:hypothetical protein
MKATPFINPKDNYFYEVNRDFGMSSETVIQTQEDNREITGT